VNATTMAAAVRRRCGLPQTDSLAADADLIELLNEASQAISTERDWPWLETSETITTVAGTGASAVPADWVRTKQLRVNLYDSMATLDSGNLDARFPDNTARGVPQAFAVQGDTILLRPVPDAAYAIEHIYYRQETQLASGSDTPLMPAWAHTAIVEWAAALFLYRARDDQRAELAMKRARDWVNRLQDNARRTTAPATVRVRAGSWI
jgi:hypothetical protein